MKVLWTATIIAGAAVTCCFAQESPTSEPPIMLKSKRAPSDLISDICVEVQIGGDKAPSLGCLNQRLKFQVDAVQPSVNTPPLDARSQDVRIGIVNAAAAAQQLVKRPPPVRIPVPGAH